MKTIIPIVRNAKMTTLFFLQKRTCGYVKGNSTKLGLLNMNEHTKQNIEMKLVAVGIFVDVTNAFHLINHPILFEKLGAYGVRGMCLELAQIISLRGSYM